MNRLKIEEMNTEMLEILKYFQEDATSCSALKHVRLKSAMSSCKRRTGLRLVLRLWEAPAKVLKKMILSFFERNSEQLRSFETTGKVSEKCPRSKIKHRKIAFTYLEPWELCGRWFLSLAFLQIRFPSEILTRQAEWLLRELEQVTLSLTLYYREY